MSKIEAVLPRALHPAVAGQLERALSEEVERRLSEGDATLWGPAGTPEIADRLGWITIAERMLDRAPALNGFAADVREAGFEDVVLLGMGGSSLAAEVIRRSLANRDSGGPRLHVLDTTDAAAILAVQEQIDLQHTLFLVSSKSGGTIEPLSLFAHFWELIGDGSHFAAITDPGSGLAKLAGEREFRRSFLGDPEIGGRYSALSVFGLVPAALIGADLRLLLGAAQRARTTTIDWQEHTYPAAVWLGATLAALARGGRNKLTFLVPDGLPGLGLWLEQLVAESTGKEGRGILPVAEEPLGEPSEYGSDRVFVHLPIEGRSGELDAGARALAGAGQPLITVANTGTSDLGRIFALFELAVAVAGWGLQINPFDQPNVQQAKDATKRVLAAYESEGKLPDIPDADEQALAALLGNAQPPSYVALMAYLEPSAEFDRAIAALRAALRSQTGVTTTFGYGPRFLHSTGQFHKGGPREGLFLQLLHDGPVDADIPGAPYTFTTLKNAQAIGDLQTLRDLSLPAERLHLYGRDPAAAVEALTERIMVITATG
jgi:glucose-6-phosphate isomerase